MKNVTYVGGSKGGTGKSLVCMALMDYTRKTFPGDEILIIETDSSNPDVGRLYKNMDGVSVQGVSLDETEKGWVLMADHIDDTDARHIIINSMAASNLAVQSQGGLFEQSIMNSKLWKANFNVFWVMNRGKDSVTLLRDFLKYIRKAAVHPVLNLYFGKEEEFLFYRSSVDIHEMIAERGGREILFPNLNDLVADKLYTDEICFEALPARLKLGMRTSLERWLDTVKHTFDQIYVPSVSEEAV